MNQPWVRPIPGPGRVEEPAPWLGATLAVFVAGLVIGAMLMGVVMLAVS